MSSPYQIFKCAILDISGYVGFGVNPNDIKDSINKVFKGNKKAAYRVLDNFFIYEIRTVYETDEEIKELMEKIVKELDILLVLSQDGKFILN